MSMAHTAQPAIALNDVLKGVMRRRAFIIGITILAFVASLAYVRLAKPRYTTEAQVIVENLATPYDQAQAQEPSRGEPLDEKTIQSQVAVLKSQDLAKRVISMLNLTSNEDVASPDVGLVNSVLIPIGLANDPRKQTPEERVLDFYYKGLIVYQLPDSSVIALKFTGKQPGLAADIVNTLASQYVAETAEVRLKPTARAREWLSQQIKDLRSKLSQSEAQIEEYRSQAGLLKGETSTLNTQELSELNRQITAAETQRTDAEQRANSIRTMLKEKGTVDDSLDVLNSPTIQRLREQQVSAARKVAELSAVYLASHPKMIAAQNELANVDKQLRREALRIVDSLAEQARIAKGRQAALEQRLAQIKTIASNANLDEVKLKALERDAAADRALLESLLLRYADASARQDVASQPALARVIQQAGVPSLPSFPNPGPTVLLASIAGLVLSLGLAFLLEVMAAASRYASGTSPSPSVQPQATPSPVILPQVPMTQTPQPPVVQEWTPSAMTAQAVSPSAAEPNIPVPVTASTPPLSCTPLATFLIMQSLQGNLALLSGGGTSAREALTAAGRIVSRWIARISAQDKLKRFALISVDAGTQASAAASLVIGRATAAGGMKTVILDLTANDASLATLAGIPDGPGLIDILQDKSAFATVVARDILSAAHIIRYGQDHSATARGLLASKLETVLETLGKLYEVVLINGGDLAASGELLGGRVQSALLLAPSARQQEVASAVRSLKAVGMSAVELIAVTYSADDVVTQPS